MAGNGNGSMVILALLCVGLGAAAGWYGRGVFDGSVVSASGAAVDAQTDVDAAIGADRQIVEARTKTDVAIERVRIETRTVEVAGDCPPGRGAVSDDWDRRLRDFAQARADASAGTKRMREKRIE